MVSTEGRAARSRAVPGLLLACALFAAACTRVPPGAEHAVGFDEPGSAGVTGLSPQLEGAEGSAGSLSLPGETWSEGLGAQQGNAPGSIGSRPGTSTSGRNTSSLGAGGGGVEGAAAGPGPGVEGRTVKVVFHHQLEQCGDDPTNNNSGTMSQKGRLVIDEYVRFFNEFVLAEHNWTLEHEIVDDGGLGCPEKAQAAGLKIAKEIKPFAAMGSLVQPARGPVVADVVTRAGILHIGHNWQLYDELRARHPYAWPTFYIAEQAFEHLTGWIAARVKGTKVDDPIAGEVDRVYGIVAVDTQEGRQLAEVLTTRLQGIGLEIAGLYTLSGDPGVAGQQAPNTVLKMRQDGVNTLVFGLPGSAFYTSVTLTEAMNSQNYLPDILIGTYGVAFFDQLHNRRVWARARGTTSVGAVVSRVAVVVNPDGTTGVDPRFSEINENSEGYVAAWNEKLGHNDNPQNGSNPGASDVWTWLSGLATGIIHAGDVLNAHTFAQGMDSAMRGGPNRCTVGRLAGRDYAYAPITAWDSTTPGGREGFTTIYWVNEQTAFNTNGYYESYDNYRFFDTPAHLPAAPSHDTGQHPVDIPKQERIGIRPWTPCSQFPNYPSS